MARSDATRSGRPLLTRWTALFVAGAVAGLVAALLAPVRANRARR